MALSKAQLLWQKLVYKVLVTTEMLLRAHIKENIAKMIRHRRSAFFLGKWCSRKIRTSATR